MKPATAPRKRSVRLVLTGILLLFLGIPFLGSAFMAFLLSGSLTIGIPAALTILAGVYFTSGFQGALVAACLAGILAAGFKRGRGIRAMAATAAAAAVIAAVLGSGYDPGFMSISSAELEPLVPLYTAAGFTQTEILRMFGLMEYLSPGFGALQITGGAIVATFFSLSLMTMFRGWKAAAEERFTLDFTLVWIVIGCLLLNVLGAKLATGQFDLVRIVRNVLIFMSLPYGILGGVITRTYLKAFPQMTIPAAIVLVFAPPLIIALLILLGILDGWFDFRQRIERRIERRRDENPSR